MLTDTPKEIASFKTSSCFPPFYIANIIHFHSLHINVSLSFPYRPTRDCLQTFLWFLQRGVTPPPSLLHVHLAFISQERGDPFRFTNYMCSSMKVHGNFSSPYCTSWNWPYGRCKKTAISRLWNKKQQLQNANVHSDSYL